MLEFVKQHASQILIMTRDPCSLITFHICIIIITFAHLTFDYFYLILLFNPLLFLVCSYLKYKMSQISCQQVRVVNKKSSPIHTSRSKICLLITLLEDMRARP